MRPVHELAPVFSRGSGAKVGVLCMLLLSRCIIREGLLGSEGERGGPKSLGLMFHVAEGGVEAELEGWER